MSVQKKPLHMHACAQKARMEAAAQRDEKERGERQQARLQAEADAHARAVADRDRFLRDLAARTGVMDVRGTGPIPEALAAQCAPAASPWAGGCTSGQNGQPPDLLP